MNSRKVDCNHPVRSRTDLKNGDGFHCDECGTDITLVPIGSESKRAATTGAIIKSEPATLPVPIVIPMADEQATVKLLATMTDQQLVGIHKASKKLDGFVLAELRVRFDNYGKIEGFEGCKTWTALVETLGIPERTARHRIAKSGMENPGKKHDGSKGRKPKALPPAPVVIDVTPLPALPAPVIIDVEPPSACAPGCTRVPHHVGVCELAPRPAPNQDLQRAGLPIEAHRAKAEAEQAPLESIVAPLRGYLLDCSIDVQSPDGEHVYLTLQFSGTVDGLRALVAAVVPTPKPDPNADVVLPDPGHKRGCYCQKCKAYNSGPQAMKRFKLKQARREDAVIAARAKRRS